MCALQAVSCKLQSAELWNCSTPPTALLVLDLDPLGAAVLLLPCAWAAAGAVGKGSPLLGGLRGGRAHRCCSASERASARYGAGGRLLCPSSQTQQGASSSSQRHACWRRWLLGDARGGRRRSDLALTARWRHEWGHVQLKETNVGLRSALVRWRGS